MSRSAPKQFPVAPPVPIRRTRGLTPVTPSNVVVPLKPLLPNEPEKPVEYVGEIELDSHSTAEPASKVDLSLHVETQPISDQQTQEPTPVSPTDPSFDSPAKAKPQLESCYEGEPRGLHVYEQQPKENSSALPIRIVYVSGPAGANPTYIGTQKVCYSMTLDYKTMPINRRRSKSTAYSMLLKGTSTTSKLQKPHSTKMKISDHRSLTIVGVSLKSFAA